MRRRTFVLAAAAATTVSGVRGLAAGSNQTRMSNLVDLSAIEAVRQMSRGELAAERYAEALLERCRAGPTRSMPSSRSIRQRVLEDARARDRERRAGAKPGRLFGLPIPVKDSVNTRDYPTTGGHARAAQLPAARGCAAGCGAEGRRRHRARQNQPARALLWLDQQQPRLRRGAQPLRSGAGIPAAAAGVPPPRSRRGWRLSGWRKIPRAPFGYRRHFAASRDSDRRRGATRRGAACRFRRSSIRSGPHARTVADLALFDAALVNDVRPLAPQLAARRAPRHRARLLVHGSRLRGRAQSRTLPWRDSRTRVQNSSKRKCPASRGSST